jgi:hypothetical protein
LEIYDNGSFCSWSTEHWEQTTDELLILLFLFHSAWIRCYMTKDLGLARGEWSKWTPDISKYSTSISKCIKIKVSKFQCRWTKELMEAVINAFVNITPPCIKHGNTWENSFI